MGNNEKTVRTYENRSNGYLLVTDSTGVKLIPWGGESREFEYGPRSWATDQVSAAQRAYAEGYSLAAIDVDGVEIYSSQNA